MKLTQALIWISIILGLAQSYADTCSRPSREEWRHDAVLTSLTNSADSTCEWQAALKKGKAEVGRLWIRAAGGEVIL